MTLIRLNTPMHQPYPIKVLLEAIKVLDAAEDTPKMVFAITGKGPMKEFYEGKIRALQLRKTTVTN